MSISFKERLIVPCISMVALIYYAILSAREYTWVFVSGDSGDWLATANWWMVPQPYGSPLYILLCRLIGLFPGNLAFNVTWFLSAIPAAISVTVVYLIVKHLTGRKLIALVSSMVLLGSTVLLTQATIVEEYALSTMFITLAIYFRVRDRHYLAALCIGLGSAVHVVVLIIALCWLAAEYKYWRDKKGAILLSAGIVVVFYSFILVLMAMDTPRLLAGGLNIESVMNYIGAVGSSVVGQLSIFEFPLRLWDFVRIVLASLGLALIPIIYSVKQKAPGVKIMLIGTIFVVFGYYLTCLDYTTWTFLALAMPSLAIMAGIGLDKLRPYHTSIVMVGCAVLIVLNGIFMNANLLTQDRPVASKYCRELSQLPPDSVVVTHACFYSLGMFYAMSDGVQVIPLVFPYLDWWKFEDYRTWLNETYNLDIPEDADTLDAISYLLDKGVPMYFAYYSNRDSELRNCLILKQGLDIRQIVGVQECSN